MAGIDLSFGGSAFPRAYEVRQKLYESAAGGVSTRFRRLDRLDAFYKCLEYDHQKRTWDGRNADDVETISPNVMVPFGWNQPAQDPGPVVARRPTAPLRLAPMVVDRFTGLLFSESRKPKVTIEGDEDADDFVRAVFKKSRFWRTLYQARTYGGSMGSALVTVQLRRGRFSFTAHSPKLVHDVVWDDPDLRTPAGVLIQYLFNREVEELDDKTGRPTGKTKTTQFLYRRIIDEWADITFVPARVSNPQEIPAEMEIDLHASYEHKLKRFPGVWIQNLPSDDELDGVSDCDGSYQMFDAIDRQISQANKGLLANQDPTLVFGRAKEYERLEVPLRKGSENALNVGVGGFAQYMEMNGGGTTAAREFVKELKTAALDKAQCIAADPEKLSGAAQSAMAIELMYQPMLEKADRLRQQYGEAIEALVDVLLALARMWGSTPDLYDVNVNSITFDLPPRLIEHDLDPNNPNPEAGRTIEFVARSPGEGGVVSLAWGPYFAPTPQDKQTLVTLFVTAFSAGTIDLETAVRKISEILDVEDAEAVLKKVREEAEAKKNELMGGFDQSLSAPVVGPDGAPIEGQLGSDGEPLPEPMAVQDTAYTGVQSSNAKEIVLDVAMQKLPRESGVQMLISFLKLPPEEAERIMGPVGTTWFTKDPEEVPPSPNFPSEPSPEEIAPPVASEGSEP